MNIQPRGADDRTWRLRWQVGRDPATGQWQRINETFHGTRKQAEAWWHARQQEIERGIGLDYIGITVAELWDRWLEAKTDIERSTRHNYVTMGRLHIIPVLGRMRVDKLTPLDIQRALTHWQTAPRLDGKPGTLSPRMVSYCRSLVVSLLDQAMQWQLVPNNVARAVKGPRQRSRSRTEESWWTLDQAHRFLERAAEDRLALVFLLALSTGLREGELIALQWTDIDWDAHTATIHQTLKRTESGYILGHPKTEASRRVVPLDRMVMEALRQHRTTQKRGHMLLGADYHDQGLVLASALGTPLNPSNVRRSFKRLCAAADVPPIKFHDLRHTHASWLIAQGVDVRTVADRLGHSQISFTLQTYVHSRVDQQRQAAEDLSRALWGDQWGD